MMEIPVKNQIQVKRGKKKPAFFKWIPLLVVAVAASVLMVVDRAVGLRAAEATISNLKEMLLFLPPVFILLGLLDVWVPRQRIVSLMGEKAGFRGILLAFFLGSAAAGPLYGAFPVSQVLLKKGASLRYVLILLGAWSTTKIPMLMFELANMGAAFMLTRLAMDFIGIAGIAILIDRLIPQEDRRLIEQKAMES